jgi:hypothetical protein
MSNIRISPENVSEQDDNDYPECPVVVEYPKQNVNKDRKGEEPIYLFTMQSHVADKILVPAPSDLRQLDSLTRQNYRKKMRYPSQ